MDGESLKYEKEIDVQSDSTHARVVRLVGENKDVCELGCSTGYMARVFREHGCRVVGIEIDPVAAAQAEAVCDEVIAADLDTVDLPSVLNGHQFDVIVAADVLEHLKRPAEVLRVLRNYLRPDGYIVASLPNIAHVSVRVALLNGTFRYTETGLLDRTHLRFFTRDSIEELFDSADFVVGHLERVDARLGETEIPVDRASVPPELIARLEQDPDALTYQFVVTAFPLPRPGLQLVKSRIADLVRRNDALGGEIARLRQTMSNATEAEGENRRLQQEIQALISREAERHIGAEHDTQEALQTVAEVTRERSDLQRSVEQLKEELAVAKNAGEEIAKLTEQASGLHRTVEKLQHELARDRRALREVTNAHEASNATLATVEAELREREAAVAELERSVKDLTSERQFLSSQLHALTARNEEMRIELETVHQLKIWKLTSVYWKVLGKLGMLKKQREAAAPAPAPSPAEPAPEMQPVVVAPEAPVAVPSAEASGLLAQLTDFCNAFAQRFHSSPSILDLTDAHLAKIAPETGAFSPNLMPRERLPYLDDSVDAVVLDHHNPFVQNGEALRVARAALLTLHRGRGGEERLIVEWLHDPAETFLPSASIIIPVHDKWAFTEACLRSLDETVGVDFAGEIIVVDDASTDETRARLEAWENATPHGRVLRNPENLGFVGSCNRGASVATSEFLVFLNNDTVTRPGWLTSLLETFSRYPSAGAVGGKLLFPNGSLQEAGARIFRDASGANFGKHDPHPESSLYNYVREVDYCSGALLATPRKLFREIGGFDPNLAPAYYEDVDYCFSVRARGLQVLYQPKSEVIHFEGGTAGTDVANGAKRYQTVNREKFLAKWNAQLQEAPLPPERYNYATLHRLATRNESQKRILIINHTVPEWDHEAGSKRLFDMIRFLVADRWAISFMAPWVPAGDRYINELEQMGVATYSKGLKKLEGSEYDTEAQRLIATGNFDIALICFWHIAEEWAPVVRKLSPKTKIVIDSVDLHFLRKSREKLRRASFDDTAPGLDQVFGDEMRRELSVYADADRVLTVSQKEANWINDLTGSSDHARMVPLTDELPPSDRKFAERSGLLFVGSFRHPPNVEAVHYLCSEILPRLSPELLQQHPVYIVGTELKPEFQKYAKSNPAIRLVGWVPSLKPYYETARVTILPLLNGAGIKLKFVQTSMIGTPTVATSVAAEGLNVVDREHALIADDPDKFASAIAELVADETLWTKLARQGREHILEFNSDRIGHDTLNTALAELLADSARR